MKKLKFMRNKNVKSIKKTGENVTKTTQGN